MATVRPNSLFIMADAPAHDELHGRSLLPLLCGDSPTSWREGHYYHYYGQYAVPSQCGLRTATHKLVHFYTQDDPNAQWELFDLHADPHELRNFAHEPAYAGVLAELRNALKAERERVGDTDFSD